MAYTRLHWVEQETPLSAHNLNNIEDGIEELQAQKVDKVSGKGLSEADFTSAEKTKLAGIAAGAEVNRTYTAVTGKPTEAASPAFGGSVTVSQVSQDANGQVSVTDRAITIPSNVATTSAPGLMSAADKTKLDGIEAGAEVNPGNASTSEAGLMSAADKTKLDGISTGAKKYTFASDSIYLSQPSGTTVISVGAGSNKQLSFDTGFPSQTIVGILGIDFRTTTDTAIYGLAITGIMPYTNSIAVRVRNVTDSEIKVSVAKSKVTVIVAAES